MSVYLIGALLIVFLAGQIIPQRRLLTNENLRIWQSDNPLLYTVFDATGLFEIYTSPVALVMLTLFFLNLVLVFQVRLSTVWKRCSMNMPGRITLHRSIKIDIGGIERDRILRRLQERLRGYRLALEGPRILAVKNRFGPMGSVLFHLSFLFLLVGGLTIYYTRSTGTMILAEGQFFDGSPKNYKSIRMPIIGSMPLIPFKVIKIIPTYEDDRPIDLAVKVQIPQVGMKYIRVNDPLALGDASILIKKIDIAPIIKLENVTSRNIYEYAAVTLNALQNRMDSYLIPYTSYRIDFLFYPDYAVEEGLEVTRSSELNNPVFRISFKEAEKEIYKGIMRPGESRTFDGFRFGIKDILYWGEFMVVKEHGDVFLWAGFITAFIGLCWRFFFYRTEVRGEFKDGILILSMWSDFPAFKNNRELEDIVTFLNKYGEHGGLTHGSV